MTRPLFFLRLHVAHRHLSHALVCGPLILVLGCLGGRDSVQAITAGFSGNTWIAVASAEGPENEAGRADFKGTWVFESDAEGTRCQRLAPAGGTPLGVDIVPTEPPLLLENDGRALIWRALDSSDRGLVAAPPLGPPAVLAAWEDRDGGFRVMTTGGLFVVASDGMLAQTLPFVSIPPPPSLGAPPGFMTTLQHYVPDSDITGTGLVCDGARAQLVAIECDTTACVARDPVDMGRCAPPSFVHDEHGTFALSVVFGFEDTLGQVQLTTPDGTTSTLAEVDVYGMATTQLQDGTLAVVTLGYGEGLTLIFRGTDGATETIDLGRQEDNRAFGRLAVAAGLDATGTSEELRVYFGMENTLREVAFEVATRQVRTRDLALCD